MGKGIVGLVQLGIVLAFAVPVGLLGLEKLLAGDALVGGAFLGIAALMVAVEEYLTTPGDLPGKLAARTLGKVPKEPDSDEQE